LLETHKHDIGDILKESLQHERDALKLYYSAARASEGQIDSDRGIRREMIRTEEHTSRGGQDAQEAGEYREGPRLRAEFSHSLP
jgi:bacterioferritin